MAVPGGSTVRWFHSGMAGAPQIMAQPGDLVAILDACLVHGFDPRAPDGNKITVAEGVATVHFSGGHAFDKWAVVEISGATPAELNGPWRITGVTSTTFTFDASGIPDGTASGSIIVKDESERWETVNPSLRGADAGHDMKAVRNMIDAGSGFGFSTKPRAGRMIRKKAK